MRRPRSGSSPRRARPASTSSIRADAYNGGNSEKVVGRAISNNRPSWVLATKLANPMGDDPNRGGLSRRWVLQAADESLKRLGTDYIDIYYLHKEDHSTPLAETVRAMGELIRKGKVRYFGVSNYRAWRVAEICNICDRPRHRPPGRQPALLQCDEPHARGRALPGLRLLWARHRALQPAGARRADRQIPSRCARRTRKRAPGRNDTRMMQTEWRPESLKLAQEIRQHAEARGITAGQFAVAWVLNTPSSPA